MFECEFMVTKKDAVSKRYEKPCGVRDALFTLAGQLTSTRMVLCEFHKNLIQTRYGWTLAPLNVSCENGPPASPTKES
jgi:hypothetical protein